MMVLISTPARRRFDLRSRRDSRIVGVKPLISTTDGRRTNFIIKRASCAHGRDGSSAVGGAEVPTYRDPASCPIVSSPHVRSA
jgi:hypothetical protein